MTEALKTQLDILQTRYYKLQVENRKLCEEKPEQVELADFESELTQTKQENISLVQQVDDLTQRIGRVSEHKEASETERLKLRERVEQLSGELGQLGGELSHQTEETQRLRAWREAVHA